jgi:hypothetical protein
VSLDEASVLRSYGSKTFQEFLPLFAKVPFKLVATATPSPNRYKELIHYAGFLGVMDTGLALTRWFQRNSEKAGDLTLYPHKEDEFWMWVHSWAAFLQRPSELGYSDDGYELPPLQLNWHEVPADHSKAEPERDGQGVMFRAVANSLQEAAKSRRDSLAPAGRQDAGDHRAGSGQPSRDLARPRGRARGDRGGAAGRGVDHRQRHGHRRARGAAARLRGGPHPALRDQADPVRLRLQLPVSLPQGDLCRAAGLRLQVQRLHPVAVPAAALRPAAFPVEVDIIYSEDERAGRDALLEKWALDAEMRRRMSEIIKRHGLDTLPLRDAMLRSIGVKRVEVRGERFVAINNDTVAECRAWPDNSVDQIVTSIPFANQYEYTPSTTTSATPTTPGISGARWISSPPSGCGC